MAGGYQRGSVRRQGNTWVLRRRVDGREQRLVIGPAVGAGKIGSARAARALADARLAALLEGPARQGERTTLAKFAPFFLEKVCAQMKGATRASYASAFRAHLLPALGKRRLTEISGRDLTELVARLEAAGKSPGTVRQVLLVLAQALRKAAANGYEAKQVDIKGLALYRKRVIVAEPRTFSSAEVWQILDAAVLPWRTLYALMAFAGLRGGEALGLTWGAIDLPGRLLTIAQQAYQGRLQSTKTASSAVPVWLNDRLLEHLAALRAHVAQQRGAEPEPTLLLFPSPKDPQRPYWTGGVRTHHFAPLLKQLGIAPAGLHAFRHTYATELLRAGTPVAVVQALLRHGDIKSTMRYSRVTLNDQKQASAAVYAATRPQAPA